MATKIDDSQIKSQKLESLIENVGYIKAPVENFIDLPAAAEDGERIYVKSLKKDYVYDILKKEWVSFGNSIPSSEEKVIVFVIQKPVLGTQKVEIAFPYQGYVTEISSSVMMPSDTETTIQVQKCSQLNYEDNMVWENVGESFTILGNKKMVNMYLDKEGEVLPNDHFRIDIKELGRNIEGLTLNIKIKLI